jgi:hypothetical protein
MIGDNVRINSAEFWSIKLPGLPQYYYELLELASNKDVSDEEVAQRLQQCQQQTNEYYEYLMNEMVRRQNADEFNGSITEILKD